MPGWWIYPPSSGVLKAGVSDTTGETHGRQGVEILILGSGQDAGIPHTGCYCGVCARARKDPASRRLGPSIALLEPGRYCYFIDASPDFKEQLDAASRRVGSVSREGKAPLSGILLTHAHMGHVTGLLHLGKEALCEHGLPVFCTPAMGEFLSSNAPFRFLVDDGHVVLSEVRPGEATALEGEDGPAITPIGVPHRDEVADTVGFVIASDKRVVYIPDLDKWTDEALDEVRRADVAIVDGTFFSKTEIPRFDDVPHPPMSETMDLLGDGVKDVVFTHVNHSNAVNRGGMEKELLEGRGFRVAFDGMTIRV